MPPSKGQLVEVQITTGRWSLAFVVKVISGDTVNLVALTDGVNPWPDSATPNGLIAGSITSANKGSSVGEWRELALPAFVTIAIEESISAALTTSGAVTATELADAISTALTTVADNLATAVSTLQGQIELLPTVTDMDTAIAAAISEASPDLSVYQVCATTSTDQVSLGLDVARRPSTTRPTRVVATGSMTLTSTLLGPQTASVQFLCDSNSTPTTQLGLAPAALSGVAAAMTVPWCLAFDVPAGHYYSLASAHSANASVTLSHIIETAG